MGGPWGKEREAAVGMAAGAAGVKGASTLDDTSVLVADGKRLRAVDGVLMGFGAPTISVFAIRRSVYEAVAEACSAVIWMAVVVVVVVVVVVDPPVQTSKPSSSGMEQRCLARPGSPGAAEAGLPCREARFQWERL